ncbi:hypothetical protein C4552_01310 [Candidatus Parcubacteria bacterium]|nr:MAG: hypothetical protein C4552_01310 [Candidatus Parcubacteria bacterium]
MDAAIPNARIWRWGIAAVAIAIVTGAVLWYGRAPSPVLPLEFSERRAEAASLLAEHNSIADVDIRPLVELESNREYAAAIALLDAALAANAAQEQASAQLAALAGDLVQLSSQIASPLAAAKAEQAFKALAAFADASARYHHDRERLFALTKRYYQDLVDGKSPEIPTELPPLAKTVTAELQTSIELSNRLRQQLREFDDLFINQ